MPMDVCHVSLGTLWQFDKKVIYDGRENIFTFEKDGRRHTLLPFKDEKLEEKVNPRALSVSEKEFLHQLKVIEVNYVVVGKPKIVLINTRFDDFLVEVQDALNEHVDIVVDDFPSELPQVRSINHHIDLIIGASFPNKDAYKITSKENGEKSKTKRKTCWIKNW